MLGHSMGTQRTFVQTSVQSATAFRGVCSPGILQPPRSVLRLYCKSLMANSRTVSVAPDLRSTTILNQAPWSLPFLGG